MKLLRRWFSITTYLSIWFVPVVTVGCALLKALSVSGWDDRSWMSVISYPAAGAVCVAAQLGLAAAVLLWSIEHDVRQPVA
ncbi:hypothetical protein L3V59_42000 (plasmid) [Burkholderia aenigmatica]|uniref:hypothetical protein n=1 Tax=Burkholderia aenigmatica TaxID=2015348 RepID=UPI001F2DB395|nr:hypothetical protein [Burkholderia aenigmatica]UKD18051.1 hypothetical protein L3V59_42000 [Burkholderia aenigmatica]